MNKPADSLLPQPAQRVMVSSTFTDLIPHRDALIQALHDHGLHAEVMEHSGPKPKGDVIDASLNMVRRSAAYILIISHKYGQIPTDAVRNPHKVSITELEFNEAQRLGRSTLVFVMGDNHAVRLADVEPSAAKKKKLVAFRARAKLAAPDSSVNRVYAVFNSLEEFTKSIAAPIADLATLLNQTSPSARIELAAPSLTPQPPDFYAARGDYIGSHEFVGRAAQLQLLSDWAQASDPDTVLLFEAIGGNGKSMLTWEWVTKHAPTVRMDWAGRFWYSFYEKGALMTDFCREALAYMTGTPVKSLEERPIAEVKQELLALLRTRPWLLILDGLERVLVAYHRIDAAEMKDEEADNPTDKVLNRNPCAAIRDEDDDLLRALAGCAPSKIVISTRLIPRVLLNASGLPIQHVQPLKLPGLEDADAETMLRANGVTGGSGSIRYYLKTYCENHPLTIGALAGLIRNYLPKRGDFDRWAADPQYGAALDLASLDLKQRRNHILTAAIAALSEPSRSLLCTLALIQESVDYETVSAFSPHPPGQTNLLSDTIRDLEQRGLLQYDNRSERYDLHPVVRGVASGALKGVDKETQGQKVIDFFNAQPRSPYDQVKTLDEVVSGVHVVRTLLKLERYQQAVDAYKGGLANALGINLEAHCETLALLSPFFPSGWATLPTTVGAWCARDLANEAAIALDYLREYEAALGAYAAALKGDLEAEDWGGGINGLANVSTNLLSQNRLASALRIKHLCLDFAIASEDEEAIFRARLFLFDDLSRSGHWAEANENWMALSGLDCPTFRGYYRLGTSEWYFARAQFWHCRLEETHLTLCEELAEKDNNRAILRHLRSLRGDRLRELGEWGVAATCYQESLSMARERRLTDEWSETALALCKYHLGELADAEEEADRLADLIEPAHRLLAELFNALGVAGKARYHALAAYHFAWGDGEPFVRRYHLTRATEILTRLGVPIPQLPVYDPAKDPPFPWEADVRAVIERLNREKAQKEAEAPPPS